MPAWMDVHGLQFEKWMQWNIVITMVDHRLFIGWALQETLCLRNWIDWEIQAAWTASPQIDGENL